VSDAGHVPLPVDGGLYTVRDAAGTLRSAVPRWRHALEGTDELPVGVAVALAGMGDALRAAGGSGEDLGALSRSVEVRLAALGREVGDGTELTEAVGPDDPLVFAVEAIDTLLAAAARSVALELVSGQRGTVAGLQVSLGGVPKLPVASVDVGPDGLVGDRQRERRHHGRPSQAVCLWSAEVIESLADAGHDLAPGAAGENVTVGGIDWSAVRPGVRLVLGDGDRAPVVELTGWAEPCSKIAHCFSDGDVGRIDHDRHPGRGRAYAAVVRGGSVSVGDTVVVLP
jgi:MOSC domain-containing protein YiiM